MSGRQITGLVVPFNQTGTTDQGRLMFKPGGLAWPEDVTRVKLLREHDQRGQVIGYAVRLEETNRGVEGTFEIPKSEAGDLALTEVRLGLRDAFSPGLWLDDATLRQLRLRVEALGRGELREVSLVCVPAFDRSRAEVA